MLKKKEIRKRICAGVMAFLIAFLSLIPTIRAEASTNIDGFYTKMGGTVDTFKISSHAQVTRDYYDNITCIEWYYQIYHSVYDGTENLFMLMVSYSPTGEYTNRCTVSFKSSESATSTYYLDYEDDKEMYVDGSGIYLPNNASSVTYGFTNSIGNGKTATITQEMLNGLVNSGRRGELYNFSDLTDIELLFINTFMSLNDMYAGGHGIYSFDANGGDKVAPNNILGNSNAIAPAYAGTKPDYYCAGWSTSPDGEVEYGVNTSLPPISSNTTLYAIYKPTMYTISYHANGGSGSMGNSTITYTGGELRENAFTRTGYTFKGWATTMGGSKEYDNKATIYPHKDMSLYAVWEVNSYAISYHANGGSGSMSDSTIAYTGGELRENAFIKAGHSFMGWATSPDGEVKYLNEATVSPTENMTLYAVWNVQNGDLKNILGLEPSATDVDIYNKVSELLANNSALKQEVADLEELLEEKDSVIDSVVDSATEIENKHDELVQEIETLENTVEEKDATIADLTSKVERLENSVREKDSTIANLTSKVENLENTIEEKDATITDLTNKVEELENGTENKNETITDLTSKVEELESTIEQKDESIADLTSKVEELENKVEENNVTITDLTSKVENLESAVEEKDETIADLTSKIENLENTIEEKEASITTLTNKTENLENTVKEKDTTISDLTNKVENLQSEKEDLKEKVNELEDKISDLVQNGNSGDKESNKDDNNSNNNSNDNSNDNSGSSSNNNNGNENSDEECREVEELKEQLASTKDQLKELEKEKETLKNQLADAKEDELSKDELSSLKQTIIEKETEVIRLTELLKSEEEVIVELEKQNTVLKETIVELEKTYEQGNSNVSNSNDTALNILKASGSLLALAFCSVGGFVLGKRKSSE